MKLLLDTHLLLWASSTPERLPHIAAERIAAPENTLFFSAASMWEIAIKHRLGRADFNVDAEALMQGLIAHGYTEIPMLGRHAILAANLPGIHKDPFDRMLLAQAINEGLFLLTADTTIIRYPGPVLPTATDLGVHEPAASYGFY